MGKVSRLCTCKKNPKPDAPPSAEKAELILILDSNRFIIRKLFFGGETCDGESRCETAGVDVDP
jgi:hypothetical protein